MAPHTFFRANGKKYAKKGSRHGHPGKSPCLAGFLFGRSLLRTWLIQILAVPFHLAYARTLTFPHKNRRAFLPPSLCRRSPGLACFSNLLRKEGNRGAAVGGKRLARLRAHTFFRANGKKYAKRVGLFRQKTENMEQIQVTENNSSRPRQEQHFSTAATAFFNQPHVKKAGGILCTRHRPHSRV